MNSSIRTVILYSIFEYTEQELWMTEYEKLKKSNNGHKLIANKMLKIFF